MKKWLWMTVVTLGLAVPSVALASTAAGGGEDGGWCCPCCCPGG